MQCTNWYCISFPYKAPRQRPDIQTWCSNRFTCRTGVTSRNHGGLALAPIIPPFHFEGDWKSIVWACNLRIHCHRPGTEARASFLSAVNHDMYKNKWALYWQTMPENIRVPSLARMGASLTLRSHKWGEHRACTCSYRYRNGSISAAWQSDTLFRLLTGFFARSRARFSSHRFTEPKNNVSCVRSSLMPNL